TVAFHSRTQTRKHSKFLSHRFPKIRRMLMPVRHRSTYSTPRHSRLLSRAILSFLSYMAALPLSYGIERQGPRQSGDGHAIARRTTSPILGSKAPTERALRYFPARSMRRTRTECTAIWIEK